jgi:hypothetical protein
VGTKKQAPKQNPQPIGARRYRAPIKSDAPPPPPKKTRRVSVRRDHFLRFSALLQRVNEFLLWNIDVLISVVI